MGVIVSLLGKIQWIPRRLICVLWVIPFLRMWMPVGVGSKYSLMSLIAKFTARTIPVYDGAVDLSMMNHVMGAETYFPITYKMELLENIFCCAAVIWSIVAAALLIAMLAVYSITQAELKDARCLHDNIYISDRVSSPAVYGIFHGRIVLPPNCDERDLKFILMHEAAHIRRKDNLWRIMAIITACVHWFNPLSWLFLKLFLESMELACDESVLKKCMAEERKDYATALINCAESKNPYASALGGAKVRVRIERILSYKQLSAFSMIAFTFFAAAVGYVLLTNAK